MRLVGGLPLLFVVSLFIFVLIDLAPGDAAAVVAGENASIERIAQVRQELGLNDPLLIRYGRWLSAALQGDLGKSLTTDQSVLSAIGQKLPVTASLTLVALVFAVTMALTFGILASLKPGGVSDRTVTMLASAAVAAPPFWLALVLVLVFSLNLRLLPALGYRPIGEEGTWIWLKHLILPGIALGTSLAAELALQLKGSLTEVLGRDYILAARAKGMPRVVIVGKHALKNAAIPVVTVLGYRFTQMLGGAVLVEVPFNLPGLGTLAIDSTLAHDVPTLLGLVVLMTAFVIVTNLLVDVSYGYFNPKVRS